MLRSDRMRIEAMCRTAAKHTLAALKYCERTNPEKASFGFVFDVKDAPGGMETVVVKIPWTDLDAGMTEQKLFQTFFNACYEPAGAPN